jgi:Putative transmembrane protein (PGPGW)
MIGRAKRSWHLFTSSKPGDRFQVRYYYHRQSRHGHSSLSRIFNIVVGSVLVLFSVFFGWAPGPGTLTLVIGLSMLGSEFLVVARFLDWAEVRLRKLAHPVGVVWRSSTIGRALIVLVAVILFFALGYVIYTVFFGG